MHSQAAVALQHILTIKKMSKATCARAPLVAATTGGLVGSLPAPRRHQILAWRFSARGSRPTSGSDCDGESPAGKNLLNLLHKLVRDDSSRTRAS